MQKYFKEHEAVRAILIAVLFVVSFALIISGWKMTGELVGLGIMVVGVFALVGALLVYNAPFTEPKKK